MEVRSIEAIVRALNEAEVQYLIVGGLAVNAHGYVRLTRDIDIVLALESENALRGLRALTKLIIIWLYPLGLKSSPIPRRGKIGDIART